MQIPRSTTLRTKFKRCGATVVEFAVITPVAFFVIFSGIELSRMSMIRNNAEIAVYEGARRGILPGATAAAVTAEVNHYLNLIGVKQKTVTITPSVITGQTQQITVSVSIPIASSTWVVGKLTKGKMITKSCTLSREWINKF